MIGLIKQLKLTEIIGILGFILSSVTLIIKIYEIRNKKAKLIIRSKTYPSELIIEMKTGNYFLDPPIDIKGKNPPKIHGTRDFRDEMAKFELIFTNTGEESVQILNLLLYINDRKKNTYFQIPLKYSTEFDFEKNKELGIYNETIDLGPKTTTHKVYMVNVSNSNTSSMPARKRALNDLIYLYLSNGKSSYYKLNI